MARARNLGMADPRLQPVGRWTPGRKDELVLAVRRGELTAGQVVEAHAITWDEWRTWNERHDRYGRRGLAVTRVQELQL